MPGVRLTALSAVVLAGGALLSFVPTPPPAAAVPSTSPGATWSTDGTVWDLVRVGDTIFLGGEFSAVVAPDGSETRPRANLAAISVTTGQPLDWAPGTDGPVLALEASAAGDRVFVGGNFGTIGGVARSRLAAVRTRDGTVDAGFTATAGGRVRSLLRQGDALFVGGEFGSIGAVGQRLVARVDTTTGAMAPGWDPVLEGGAVRGMALSPDGSRLYLSGSFTSVDGGADTRYAAAVSAPTGQLSPWRAPVDQPLFDVAATDTAVYLAVGGPGIPNNRLQKHSADTGAELYRYIADGDLQDLEIFGSTLFVGGHFDTDFDGLSRTMLVAIDLSDDQVIDWMPEVHTLYGVWKVLAGPEGIWLAGQFTEVGGQARRGLAFLPDAFPQPATRRLLIDRFGVWRYQTSAPPSGWSAPAFDDSTWASGPAELGYGDGDERTRVAATRTLYLRRTFTVTDRTAWRALGLRLLADAGAAVYLNGTEVARDNLPAGPLTPDTQALAGKWTRAERAYVESEVPVALLVDGVNTLAVEVHTTAGPEDLSFALELLGEPKGPATELVGANWMWRYRDSGVTPPTTWRTREFDHGSWRRGRGQLGAGDGDEATVLNRTAPAHVTDWYRLWFPVQNRSRFRWAILRLLADDGAVVYLNGTEIVRDNLPDGAITANVRALAPRSGVAERTWRGFPIPIQLLQEGTNLLAVEVHQTGPWDPDSSLALRVQAGA